MVRLPSNMEPPMNRTIATAEAIQIAAKKVAKFKVGAELARTVHP